MRFELTTSALPRRRSVPWSYRGDVWEQDPNLGAPISGTGGMLATHPDWSRHPVPTRAIRRTKAEPQPCAAASLPGKDSNLDSRRPERRGLPN